MSLSLEILTTQYGVLLTYEQCAKIFNRSESGLRVSLCRETDEASQKINSAKVRIGRRIMFRTVDIAKIIDEA